MRAAALLLLLAVPLAVPLAAAGAVGARSAPPRPSPPQPALAAAQDIVEQIRDIILNGDPERGIPVLDPFQLEHEEIELEREGAYEVEAQVDAVTVRGLGDFNASLATNVGVLPPRLVVDVDVVVPVLTAQGDYELDALVGDAIRFFGEGPFRVVLQNPEVKVKARLTPKLTGPSLSSLDIEVDVQDFEIQMDGLLGGGPVNDLLNQVINQLAEVLFKEQKEAIESKIEEFMFPVLDNMISQWTWGELLCLVANICT